MDPNIVNRLADMGHQITLEAPDNAFGFGGAQLIFKMENGLYIWAGQSREKMVMLVAFNKC